MKFKKKMEQAKENMMADESGKSKSNPWMYACVILGVAVIILFAMVIMQGGIGSTNSAGKKIVEFLNTKTGGGVTLVSAEKQDGLVLVNVMYKNETVPVYTTYNGDWFVQGPIKTSEEAADNSDTNTQTPTEVPKSDDVKGELFVMTHCPYGTQAGNGFIPVMKALAGKADVNIRFVHYFMHGEREEAETYTQLCIREEQNSKFLTYLDCFLAGDGSEAGSKTCLTKSGIDQAKLNTCLADDKKKAKEYYAADSKLSQQYGVQGSPTLIVNGVEAQPADRSADAFLKAVCSGFNTAPAECSKALSTTVYNPGFGKATSTSGAASSASCG